MRWPVVGAAPRRCCGSPRRVAFLPPAVALPVIIAIIVLVAVLPIVLSYLFWRKERTDVAA